MKLVIFSLPGGGKTTQAKKISEKYDLIHISIGDILRKAVNDNTELGKKSKEFMDKGSFVPDEIIIPMVKEHLSEIKYDNFVLEGYPRTYTQAVALDKIVDIDIILNLVNSDDVIIDRLSKRLTCTRCCAVYNIKDNPPKIKNICDKCNIELSKRNDDKSENVKKRLEKYHRETIPVLQYYRKKNKLIDIHCDGINERFTKICKIIETNIIMK